MAFGQSFNGFGQQLPMQQMTMQGMLQGMPQQMPMQQMPMQQASAAVCGLVSCEEEVRAARADLSGAPSLFYNPHASVFYIKRVDQMTGQTVVDRFTKAQPEQAQAEAAVAELLARVQKLEETVAAQAAPKGRKAAAVNDGE